MDKYRALLLETISQLRNGDVVTVTSKTNDGVRWVSGMFEGSGSFTGEVTAIGKKWIEVKPAEGKALRLIPPWRGGMPRDGGGLDKAMLEKIYAQKVGTKVRLSWKIDERKRVMDVAPVD